MYSCDGKAEFSAAITPLWCLDTTIIYIIQCHMILQKLF